MPHTGRLLRIKSFALFPTLVDNKIKNNINICFLNLKGTFLFLHKKEKCQKKVGKKGKNSDGGKGTIRQKVFFHYLKYQPLSVT